MSYSKHPPDIKDNDNEKSSDWNAGIYFYDYLMKLRGAHISYYTDGDLIESVDVLASEIDWVSTDIGENDLKKLRNMVDSISDTLERNDNQTSRRNAKRQIKLARRKLWDLEMKYNISRPKDNTDLSDISTVRLND